MKDSIQLDSVALLGRTLEEYAAYFELRDETLRDQRILDVGAGVSSFCAEASAAGHDVTATDPIYELTAETISDRCRADLENVVSQLPSVLHLYHWNGFYRDVADLARHRELAYHRFLTHYRGAPQHYVAASLPGLPFGDDRFSLTLVSYLLFLYDDRLDYAFHRDSLLELARVTRGEVRVYPLATMRGRRSELVERVLADPCLASLSMEVRATPFRFLKESGEVLTLRKRCPGPSPSPEP